jgi:hypothetical protein
MLYVIDDIDVLSIEDLPCDIEAAKQIVSRIRQDAVVSLRAKGVSAEFIDKKIYHNLEASCKTHRISLAANSLFPTANHYLNITRAVVQIEAASKGPFYLVARPGHLSVESQLDLVASEMALLPYPSQISLLDDGIGAGAMTIRRVCEGLAARGQIVSEIVVGISSNPQMFVNDIPVRAGVELEGGASWINLRDLIWGFPGSGVTLIEHGSVVGGIPYGFNCDIATARAVSADNARKFCEASEDLSCAFWDKVCRALRRVVTLEMVPRLSFLSARVGIDCPVDRLIRSMCSTGSGQSSSHQRQC